MRLIACGLVLAIFTFPCWGETIIVDQNGSGDFNNIQDAINSSWHNDTILVYPGTYNENISVSGVNILLTSIDPDDSNTVNATIITGSVSFQVAQKSTLTGFKLDGASITCYGASPIITKNIIENCSHINGTAEGGAIRGYTNSTPEITYNIIRNNEIYQVYSSGSNTAVGGAIANCNGLIAHNVIACNTARADSWSAPNGRDQTAHTYGGGLYQCNGTIINNTIVGNVCSTRAGRYSGRFGEALGAGLYKCNGIVVNNIIAFNQCLPETSYEGGGIYGKCKNSYNCFWQNLPNDLAGGALVGTGDFGGNPRFAEDGYMSGYHWIYGEYHLKSQVGRWDSNSLQWVNDSVTSYCIDMGDPCTPIGIEPNPNGARINMGAYGGTPQASKSPSGIVQPVCTAPIVGDLNGDCKVDYEDFATIASHWLECNLDPPSACWQ